jgi:hypothetical protein
MAGEPDTDGLTTARWRAWPAAAVHRSQFEAQRPVPVNLREQVEQRRVAVQRRGANLGRGWGAANVGLLPKVGQQGNRPGMSACRHADGTGERERSGGYRTMCGRTGESAIVRRSSIRRVVLNRTMDRPDAVPQRFLGAVPDELRSFGSRFRWDA